MWPRLAGVAQSDSAAWVRFLSWLGVIAVLVALGAGAVSGFAHTSGTRAPAEVSFAGYHAGPRHAAPYQRRSPSPVAISISATTSTNQQSSTAVGSTQQALINQDRARQGLPPLSWSSCLDAVAVSNAVRMAGQRYISHANGPAHDLACGLGQRAGENVGLWSGGIADALLNTMFMNSPEHRANIFGAYHYVATAWAIASNGAAYVAVEFG